MTVSRRDFLKGLVAVGVITALPADTTALEDKFSEGIWFNVRNGDLLTNGANAGIEPVGNGWYRVWTVSEDYTYSAYAKADTEDFFQIIHNKGHVKVNAKAGNLWGNQIEGPWRGDPIGVTVNG